MKKFIMFAGATMLASTAAFASGVCTGSTGNTGSGNTATTVTIASGQLTLTWNGAGNFTTGDTLVSFANDICTVNGQSFSNFEVNYNSGPGMAALSTTFNPTLNNNQLTIGTTNLGGNDIQVYFQTNQYDGMLGLAGGGGETVTETVCGSPYTIGQESCTPGPALANLSVTTGNEGPVYTTESVSNSGTYYIVKDDSGGSSLTETFAPEPMTMSLMGVGLLGLGIAGRRRFGKK